MLSFVAYAVAFARLLYRLVMNKFRKTFGLYYRKCFLVSLYKSKAPEPSKRHIDVILIGSYALGKSEYLRREIFIKKKTVKERRLRSAPYMFFRFSPTRSLSRKPRPDIFRAALTAICRKPPNCLYTAGIFQFR